MRTAKALIQVSKKYMAYDDFNRADGLLGTSVSGHAWSDSGATWNIVSNQVRQTADTNGGHTFVTMPGLDYVVEAKIVALNTFVELIARRSSSTNYYVAAYDSSGSAILLKQLTGSSGTLGSTSSSGFVAGDVLGLSVKGPRIRLLRNRVPIISVDDYSLADGLGAGLRNGIGGAVGTKVYDDFRVSYPI